MSNKVLKRLDYLGRTGDEVADTLRSLHVTGSVGEAESCPVANYLKGYFDHASVALYIHVWDTGSRPSLGERIHTPPPIVEFIKAFDEGEYEDLLA